MANVFKRFFKGILLVGESTNPSDNKEGSVFHIKQNTDPGSPSPDNGPRLKTYIESAVREIVTNSQTQVLTNKTIQVSNNTVITAASGNLTSTNLNAALSELQTDIDSRATSASLTAHINDFSSAHDAAAISFDKLPYTITSNDVQGAVGETWVTLQGHLADSSDAHDASAISVVPSGALGSTDVQAALQELQTDVDSRVTTASNVGTGSGVFKQKSGSTLELKSLSAGSNITLTEVGDSIQVSAANPVISDATTSSKGVVKLAGDLAGTADFPTVPALSTKAGLISPAFSGIPTAPTALAGTSTSQIATTEFVQNAVSGGGGGGGGTSIAVQLTEFAASNWTHISSPEQNSWYGVTFGTIYGANYFVAVSIDGTNRIMVSSDGGNTWTSRAAPQQNTWRAISSGNNMFVAVTGTGTSRVMKSEDTITWTSVNVPLDAWKSIAFGNYKFVAVADTSGGTGKVMYSSAAADTWTLATAPVSNWQSITYGNNIFVAVGIGAGGPNWAMASSDGITWTSVTSQVSGAYPQLYSVTFGNGKFVAYGVLSGSGQRVILTSVDGLNWSVSATGTLNRTWNSLTYGNGLYVAIRGNDLNRQDIMTSPDAITWTLRTTEVPGLFYNSITYGDGIFLSVAYAGGVGTPRIVKSLRHT